MKPLAILHEGGKGKSEDYQLIELLIKHLQLDINKVEFYGMGSKSNFEHANFNLLKNQLRNLFSAD